MCIACELGYWAMVDALEAERDAAKNGTAAKDTPFACEPAAEGTGANSATRVRRTVDEPAP